MTSRFASLVTLVGVCLVLAHGCGDDDRGTPRDGGSADASAPADASSTDAPSADAGPADGGPMCTENLVTLVEGRPCSTELRDCTMACTDESCLDDCFETLADPACTNCMNRALIACVNRNGCQELWNCSAECIQEHCTGTPDLDACIAASCMAEDDAYYDCVPMTLSTCGTRYVDCLPE
jgi:hypothetical protein